MQYENRVALYESQGMTRSDAQSVVEAEDLKLSRIKPTAYAEMFVRLQPDYSPRHIEAYVRCECGTISNLTQAKIRREAKIAAQCIDVGGIDAAERLAQSFGI